MAKLEVTWVDNFNHCENGQYYFIKSEKSKNKYSISRYNNSCQNFFRCPDNFDEQIYQLSFSYQRFRNLGWRISLEPVQMPEVG